MLCFFLAAETGLIRGRPRPDPCGQASPAKTVRIQEGGKSAYIMTRAPDGIILIDKPLGMTSHDVVDRLRRIAGTRRIGHAGTLDPMAEGLLVVCVGPATRVIQFLTGLDKVYAGTITLGAISSTYDAEGKITPQGRPMPSEDRLREAMACQTGDIIQLPPPYSAVKVRGRKLYEYARAGEPVPQKPRPVRVARFDLLRYEPPEAHFEARVSSGTYIRSMAHAVGIALECGGYLSRLRRTRVGGFSAEQAVPLETLMVEPALLPAFLMSLTEALNHLPKVTLHPGAVQPHLNGQPFTSREILELDGMVCPGQPVLVVNLKGNALSVARADIPPAAGEEQDERSGPKPPLGATELIFRPMRVLARPEPPA